MMSSWHFTSVPLDSTYGSPGPQEMKLEASRPDSSAFTIIFLATEYLPKGKLGQVDVSTIIDQTHSSIS